MNDCGAKAAREKASSQLTALAASVRERALKLSGTIEDRLNPVVRQGALATGTSQAPNQTAETWPPLLSDLRTELWAIESSLKQSEETLSRLEI